MGMRACCIRVGPRLGLGWFHARSCCLFPLRWHGCPQGGSGSYRLGLMRGFWNDRDRYDLVACGAAAGVAAAFRSPVGGVLFALEEMTSWWKNQMLWLAFFTTAGKVQEGAPQGCTN